MFYLDTPNTNLRHLRLDSLNVSGYQKTGITISSWKGKSGYTDVRITNSQVFANGENGLTSASQDLAAHRNWYVGNIKAYENSGRADMPNKHTGSGIVLSGIDGALVENCEAYNNGWLNACTDGGPVGIWGWCCNNLVIQKCESHHNSSGTAIDGGGFDLDGGCTNSVLQYNYSHDNGGPGYLLAQYPGAPPMTDLIVRYNVSKNDARRDHQGAIAIWSTGSNGGIQRAVIHNNTVLLSRPANGSYPRAVSILSDGISEVSLRNNVLKTSDGLPVVTSRTSTGVRLQGNLYWSDSRALSVQWNGTTYTDLASWRNATGQEKLANGRATGIYADPELPSATSTYQPLPTSPARGAGLNLQAEFNLSHGPRDFAGNPTPPMSAAGNIGALETGVFAPLPVTLVSFTAEQQGTAALLRWSTATEKNNAYFAVESSRDGQTFTALNLVSGYGNSARLQTYQYTDQNLARYATNTVYYRLRQVDLDEKTTYSPVVTLSVNSAANSVANSLQVLPNPAVAGTTVAVKGADRASIQLFNVRGQLVETVAVGANGTATLPVAGLPAGIYIVRSGAQSTRLVIAN
ncbi:T9SS type A sorting domain-containing protein [Hymenobacter arizonensis]|uniref:T9SS type A sorting domain-containing protein n=1 Tax=Hymenobacter arizonensis TaxID=1227077 RepID=UPI0015A5AE2D|nr:T9SS type A sorting domain-containing protein [Hymenobacter arizonensis]